MQVGSLSRLAILSCDAIIAAARCGSHTGRKVLGFGAWNAGQFGYLQAEAAFAPFHAT